MLSYIPTASASAAKKKIKKPKVFSCTTCPLSKKFENTPVYSDDKLIPFETIREDTVEKIVVVLIGRPYSSYEILQGVQRGMLGEMTHKCLPNATKIYMFPVIKCPHDKEPTKNMVTCCENMLREELIKANPDVIICLGKAACAPFKLDGQAKEIYNRLYTVLPISLGDKTTKECKLIATESVDKFSSDIKLVEAVEAALKQADRQLSGEDISKPDNYYLIESPEEFNNWCNAHMTDEILKTKVHAFDIESNGREIHPKNEFDLQHPAKLRCISFSWDTGCAVCVPIEEDYDGYYPVLKRFMESGISFIGHNVSFDYFFLKIVNNITTKNIVGDTMNMAYLLGYGGYAGLKMLSSQLTGLGSYETDMKSIPDEFDEEGNIIKTKWEQADMATMAPYNCADSDATLQIYKQFIHKIREQNMLPAHWIMTKALLHLGEMEHMGLHVNKEWVDNAKQRMETLLEQYKEELKALCNGKEYDWNSPQEMGHVLYDLFGYDVPIMESGGFSASDEDDTDANRPTGDVALSIINTPFTQALRKYRKCFKLLSTYFNGYLGSTGLDGNLRSRYNLTGTATGRLSSSGIGDAKINMQNLPSSWAPTDPGYEDMHEYKVKKAFVPRNRGWVMINGDMSQAEMRLSAAMSNEKNLIQAYENGIDAHSRNAKAAFMIKTPDEEFKQELIKQNLKPGTEKYEIELLKLQCKYIKKNMSDLRQSAKVVSFGILYAMAKYGLHTTLVNQAIASGKECKYTVDDCDNMIKNFSISYPALTKWQNDQIQFAKKYGYVQTPLGRRRYLPNINNRQDFKLRSKDERRAKNTSIQGTSSDMVMCGLINLYEKMDHTKAYLVCTVHDSFVAECAPDYVDEFIALAKECLEHPKIGKTETPLSKRIPFQAEFEVGPSYGELGEYTYPYNKEK